MESDLAVAEQRPQGVEVLANVTGGAVEVDTLALLDWSPVGHPQAEDQASSAGSLDRLGLTGHGDRVPGMGHGHGGAESYVRYLDGNGREGRERVEVVHLSEPHRRQAGGGGITGLTD